MKLRLTRIKGMDHQSPVTDLAIMAKGNAIVSSTPLIALLDQATRTLDRDAILAIGSQISEAITPKLACANGCSHCCYMGVAITEFEARKISDFIGKPLAIKGDAFSYMENYNVEQYATVPCTFLVNEQCSIYSVRPLACRLHHNLAPDSSVCEIKLPLESMAATPSINLNDISFWFANLGLRAGDGFADIREYFPKD